MFEVEYKGGTTVVLSTKKSAVVVDPKAVEKGLKNTVIKEAIEIASENRFVANGKDAALIIDGPGEYEVKDFSIKGIPAVRHLDAPDSIPVATMYRVEIEGFRIAVLGNVTAKLTDDQLEEIGVVDIVIIPIGGGGYTLDATGAASMVRQLDARVVIPVHYADPAVAYEVPQDTLETFTAELGAPVESVGVKYKLKSVSALPPALQVVVIERN